MGVYVRNSARSGELFFVEGGFWADTESLVYQIYFLNVHSSKIIILQSLNETSLPTVVLSPSFRESKKSLEENSALALAAPKTDRKTSPKRLAEMGPEAWAEKQAQLAETRKQRAAAELKQATAVLHQKQAKARKKKDFELGHRNLTLYNAGPWTFFSHLDRRNTRYLERRPLP